MVLMVGRGLPKRNMMLKKGLTVLLKRFLRRLVLRVVYGLGAPGAHQTAHEVGQRTRHAPEILLVRPDHLGDLILVTPILNALRTRVPNARITMMVGPWSSEIVTRHPAVDRVITCPFPGFQRAPQGALEPYKLLLSVARQLHRKEKYDLAINLRPDFWWGAALLHLAGIPCRVGYALQPGQPFLNVALPVSEREHATVANLRLASAGLVALGYEPLAEPFTSADYPTQFAPMEEERAWARARLRADGIAEDAPLIVIPPGSGGAVKLWRSQAWANCANRLQAALTLPRPARIMLTGSPAERPLLEEVAQDIAPAATLVTDASVGQLAALLEHATCVLTVDNGPGHIAVAQGTPSVHLFGPTDPRIFGPWGDPTRHIVLASSQRCPTCPTIPCGRLDWSQEELAEHPCVRVIEEERVMQAARTLLGMRE